MSETHAVPLSMLVKEFHLEVAYAATDFSSIRLTVEDVARPGLQLAGYFDHYEPMRLQVMGNVEMSYLTKLSSRERSAIFLTKLSSRERSAIFDRLFSYKFPALLIARGIAPHEEMLRMAQKQNITILCTKEPTSAIVSSIITYLKGALAPSIAPHEEMLRMAQKQNITILCTKEPTSAIVSSIITYLKGALAPSITRHGVLMEVYGEGILLIGDSGIGKSEAAVELLKRGHRLIADDAVEIHRVSSSSMPWRSGESPPPPWWAPPRS